MQTHNETQRHWMIGLGMVKPDAGFWMDRNLRPTIGAYSPKSVGKKLPKSVVSDLKKHIKAHIVTNPDIKSKLIYDRLFKTGRIPKRECGKLITLKAFYGHVVDCRNELNEGN